MKKLSRKNIIFSFCFLAGLFGLGAGPAWAQERMALTITPPIIKNNVNPGQIWKSYIKVVNNNQTEMEAYVQLVNFESGSESGTVRLAPLPEETIKANPYLVNNWVIVEEGPYKIAAGKSYDIPFIVDVPEEADPGDHHIALLVGTQPRDKTDEGSAIKISSMLGSLLLLNVNGDVEESGLIREFTTDKQLYSQGEAKFTLRFQNTGNTILQPQGEIKIFDFQGKERGDVKINHQTSTGNVFPEDVRKWEYAWSVPEGLLDMGRYRAEMILSYGNESKQTSSQILFFWVIQWKLLLIAFGSFFFVIILIVWLVRRYVRKAIQETEERLAELRPTSRATRTGTSKKISHDDKRAVVDLKASSLTSAPARQKAIVRKKGPLLPILLVLTAVLIACAVFFFLYLSTREKPGAPIRELPSQGLLEEVDRE
jgi:hypothetical protein